jgi:hypothetical protein
MHAVAEATGSSFSFVGNHVGADGRAASINVGELYDGEERRFLVLVYVLGAGRRWRSLASSRRAAPAQRPRRARLFARRSKWRSDGQGRR